MSISERWRHHETLPEEIRQRLQTLPDLLRARGVRLAYLFGSLAHAGSGQDVDIALLTIEEPAYQLRDAITQWLDTERVDIIDLRRASPVFRMEIIETGVPLYEADDDVRLDFELRTMREYRDTAYLRRQQETLLRSRLTQ
ncbi:MAG: type VII toxin-antitoxin system MntA family adenylyltransferase antitoxin [Chloroflexota bacterium]